MLRLLFEKKGNAIWISHLDLMRLFQRAFKRSGLLLKHTQGFNPRPSVSIALPLSVGIESQCELLEFEIENHEEVSCNTIKKLLNQNLIDGVNVLSVYDSERKYRDIAYLDCSIDLYYDNGVSDNCLDAIKSLFARDEIVLPKKTKNGIKDQNIIPMIKSLSVDRVGDEQLTIRGVICCQNPSLNPAQLMLAINTYCPECNPDFSKCCRVEIFDHENQVFR